MRAFYTRGAAVSDELTILLRPFAGYAELQRRFAGGGDTRALLLRSASIVFALGAIGSITLAGRWVAAHVALIAGAWAFAPVMQWITAGLVSRGATRPLPALRAAQLHMAGNGPWFVGLFFLGGVVLLAPDVAAAFRWMLDSRTVFLLAAMVMGAGSLTSFAFYRVCGESSRRRAATLVAVEWMLKVCLCLLWYAFMDNLLPQFLGPRGAP